MSAHTGRQLVALVAPDIASVLDRMEAAMWREVGADLAGLAAQVAADAHRRDPLTSASGVRRLAEGADWRSVADLDDATKAACRFAEQFALDVGALDDATRTDALSSLGDKAFPFVQATYVADIVGRVRTVLDRIAGAASGSTGGGAVSPDGDSTLWSAIEDLIRLVPGLEGLDAVTTEYVRLRGARAHRCRKCQSLRSRPALVAGAAIEDFDLIDDYVGRGLPAALETALAFTDAFVWSPAAIGDDLLEALRRHYTVAQQVELVLDIARNATNKIAVALGADGTDVTEGYEVYEVFADGSIEYGLAHP